jgi:hypothetical protein
MTGHGFRATFRTIGDEVVKLRVDLIEHQLAHKVKDSKWACLQPNGVPGRSKASYAGAKLQPAQQEQALANCFREEWNGAGAKAKRIMLPVRHL